jgi:hypothetical protein
MEDKVIKFNAGYINMLLMAIVAAFGIGFSLMDSPNLVLFFCIACLLASGWQLFFDLPKNKSDSIKI